jgi:hypothetical protein
MVRTRQIKPRPGKRVARYPLFIVFGVIFVSILAVSLGGKLLISMITHYTSDPKVGSSTLSKITYRGTVNYQYFKGEDFGFRCNEETGYLELSSAAGTILWQKPYHDSLCERRLEGHKRLHPEVSDVFVILKDRSFHLTCVGEAGQSFTSCTEKAILDGVTTDNFLMLDENESFLLSTPNMQARTHITLLDLKTSVSKEIALPHQFLHASFTALPNDNSFAYWADKEYQPGNSIDMMRMHPLLGIYDGENIKYIDGIPKTITWGEHTYTIDGYNSIHFLKNDGLCFGWSVSGGNGIYVRKNGVFVQDPPGVESCLQLE